MKRSTAITAERVKQNRQRNFNPIAGLTPKLLAQRLDEFLCGNLRGCALLWDRMLNRDGTLKTVSSKRLKTAARRPWEVLTIDDSPRAAAHAAALRYVYENLSVTSAHEPNERGGFSLLIRQMLSAIGMRYAIHEIVLRPMRANGKEIKLDDTGTTIKLDTLLKVELRFCPLWWFEARNGPLAYLRNDWDYFGETLKDGEWMVTLGDGLMEACSVEYIYKATSRKSLLGYSDKFGQPAIDASTTDAPGSEGWEELKSAVADFGENLSIVRGSNASINLIEAKNAASSLPMPVIMEDAKREIITIWRGGDLSTLSSKEGEGTGASLQGDESNALTEDDCQIATETLNAQFDTLVIRYLFGEEPLAYVKVIPPKQLNVSQDKDTAKWMVERGMKVGQRQVRERLGWPEPDEDDDLIEAPEPQPGPGNLIGLANEAGRSELAQALAADLQPFLRVFSERLESILQISDPDLRVEKFKALWEETAPLRKDILVDPASAGVLHSLMARSIAGSLLKK